VSLRLWGRVLVEEEGGVVEEEKTYVVGLSMGWSVMMM
jgi:hypothetical protein